MKKYLNKYFHDFFMLSKSEQKGIFILVALTLIIVVLNYLLPHFITHKKNVPHDFIAQVNHFKKAQQIAADSVYADRLQSKGQLTDSLAKARLKPFPFNPNNLPEEKWKALGLTKKQIRTIKNYEAKGGKFRSKGDLEKIYVISESEYRILEPYIVLPTTQLKPNPKQKVRKERAYKAVELNSADSTTLVQNLKLSPWLAARIIKFRKLLGGFANINQLYEVYGFDSTEIQKRIRFVKVDSTTIIKLNLNTDPFKTLLSHPYLSYDMVVAIFKLRPQADSAIILNSLLESGSISREEFKKLAPYIKQD